MALTAKQEAFCLKVVEGLSLSDAYRAAYDCDKMKSETINRAAAELMANPVIATRIGDLRGAVAARVVKNRAHDLATILDEAEEARALAHAVGQAGAASAAVTLKAKLMGLLVEKREVRSGPLDEADLEELIAMKNQLKQQAAGDQGIDALLGQADPQAQPAAQPGQAARPARRVVGG